MSEMSANELFFRFMAKEEGTAAVLAAPIYGTYFCASWLGREWIRPWLDNQTLDELVECGETAGVIPMVCLGWWDLNPFGWDSEQSGGDAQCHRWTLRLRAGGREVRQEMEDRPKVGMTMVRYAVGSVEDYWVFGENLRRLKGERGRMYERMCEVVERVGKRGVVYLNVPLPHVMFGYIEDTQLSYDLADHPREVRGAFDRCYEAGQELTAMGLEAGIRVFFGATKGILGPKVLREHMMGYAVRIREMVHGRGGYYYLHECGRMRALLEAGIYGELAPDILEGFDHAPVGDIDDLGWARGQLGAETIFKGSIRLEDMLDGPAERIWGLCEETVASVGGYRHLLGTSCSVLYGTPMEHVRVLGEYCRQLNRRSVSG